MKSSLLPYRRVVIIRSSKDSSRKKRVTTLDNITWDILSFYSNIEPTCRAWVSRTLWSRTSPSLMVSVHEHVLSVKYQTPLINLVQVFPFFRTMPVITSSSPAQEPVMFSIPHGNTDDGSPQLRHAQTVQTPKEINLQQNIRALERLWAKLPASAGTWVCCPPPAPQLWHQPRPGMQQ